MIHTFLYVVRWLFSSFFPKSSEVFGMNSFLHFNGIWRKKKEIRAILSIPKIPKHTHSQLKWCWFFLEWPKVKRCVTICRLLCCRCKFFSSLFFIVPNYYRIQWNEKRKYNEPYPKTWMIIMKKLLYLMEPFFIHIYILFHHLFACLLTLLPSSK